MMASPSELGFDCKPQIYSMLMKSFGDLATEQTQKLEEFLARLEEEKLKIDAFKRELPLCMQLITSALEVSRQQLLSHRTNQTVAKPVLEEFIPLKTNTSSSVTDYEQVNNISSDKANWMTSAQLWNQQTESSKNPQSIITSSDQETEIKLGLNGQQRINGAFHPFSTSKDSRGCNEVYPELALASLHTKEEMEDNKNTLEMRENSGKYNNNSHGGEKDMIANNTSQNQSQSQRKARRCWSPDLHRRFVNALHLLGGSQVATPKQIRELMKVDGLTNDEVKSHLQKYRLHTRRPSPSPQTAVTAAPQVVVLGGIWVPPEYAAAAAHGGGLYGAHAATTHHVSPPFCSPPPQTVAQEMYPALAPPPLPLPPNHHLHQQQQVHMYNNKPPLTQGNTSPESDIQGGGAGDPSESIEDGKSESGSWKADSGGENGGDRRRLDGEESVVSLKF